MNIPHYILYIFAALAFTAKPAAASADSPHADSTATGHYVHQLMFDFKPGAILHTNDFLRGSNPDVRTMNHDIGFHLK